MLTRSRCRFTRAAGPAAQVAGKVALVLVLLGIVAAAPATVVIENYGPFRVTFYGNGDGGSDSGLTGEQDWTAEQRTDVGAAVNAWAGPITDTPGRQVELHMFWREMDVYGTNVLGGSSSADTWDGTTIWNAAEYVWKEGVNYSSSTNYDTFIQFDITAAGVGGGWNFGTGNAAGNAIDFRSVTVHEIGHSVGFSSSYERTRRDFGSLGPGFGYGGLTAWDEFLVDSDGDKAPAGGGKARKFNATDDPAFWDGPIATDYYGGLVPIYAPSPYQSGSSLSHVDEALLPGALMSPQIGTGQMVRQPTTLEWKMMEDMGWSVSYILGDFDLNGQIDGYDIDLLADFIRLGSAYDAAFDLSADGTTGGQDGLVDLNDMNYLVRSLVGTSVGAGTEYGDFNLDGLIDTTDLTILGTNFGPGSTWAEGNANRYLDLVIDTTDLTILGTYFGFAATADAIPEPATLSLLALGGLALMRRKK